MNARAVAALTNVLAGGPAPSCLTAALEYRGRYGLSVIALHGDGDTENRKRPAVASWRQYQEAAPTEEEITAMFAGDRPRNVAILTGSVSRLVALDLDGPHAATLFKARGITLPRTATVQTGRGCHVLYRYSGADIGNRARLLRDGNGNAVDVRGEGGYIVAPPSVHGSGRVYQWIVGLEELAPLPPDLEELLVAGAEQPVDRGETVDWWPEVVGGVTEGKRNESAAKVAGYFARTTVGNVEAVTRAMALWNGRNDPPLPEAEITSVVRSVLRLEDVRRRAEAAKALPRVQVADGERLATELAHAEPRRGIAVDVPGFDLVDGLVAGDMIVIAGRPGMGKTTLATQLTASACLARHVSTLIVSTELNRGQWAAWAAAAALGCAIHDLPRPRPESLLELFRRAPIGVADAGAPSIADVRALAESRPGLRLLIVDHLGRLTGGRRETRALEVGDVARGLKAIARDLECTVVALCQLNRDIEIRENKRPRLADLRDSGEVEQEADAVFFLYAPTPIDKTTPTRDVVLALEKFRHGAPHDQPVTFHTAGKRFAARGGAR